MSLIIDINNTLGQVHEQKLEQKLEQVREPERGKDDSFIMCNGKNCSCPKCRKRYVLQNGKVVIKIKSIVSDDRSKTLDSYEYMMDKRTNKFSDAEEYNSGK